MMLKVVASVMSKFSGYLPELLVSAVAVRPMTGTSQLFNYIFQVSIFRPEIMAPF
jgi:hypothetical protein